MKKYREFYLSDARVETEIKDGRIQHYHVAFSKMDGVIVTGEAIHVIEFSAYQALQAEIEYLKRMLADERSGDCDKDKTIRRLKSNNQALQSLKEQCEKLEKALERLDVLLKKENIKLDFYSQMSIDKALEEYRKFKGDK